MTMKNKILYFLCIGLFACYGSTYATGIDNKEDSLAVYIAEAIRNNPALMSEYQAYQAQMTNAQGAGVLSDPQLSVGLFPQAIHHVNGKQLATITIMQMFPWFGTLKAGREQMEYKAQEAYQKFREKSLSTAFNVEKQWYSILATQEKVKAVKQKRTLLNDIKKVAIYLYKNYTSGRDTKMSDQLRLDAEEERLKEQTESLETQLTLIIVGCATFHELCTMDSRRNLFTINGDCDAHHGHHHVFSIHVGHHWHVNFPIEHILKSHTYHGHTFCSGLLFL